MSGELRWHVHADADALAQALASDIAERARAAIDAHGAYRLALAGGSTPRRLYTLLRELRTEWRRWHCYFGDERCVPHGDPERNDSMARAAWLDHVAIPPENIYAIPAELGPEAGAAAYRDVLRDIGPFDTTLLGLGEDGHTASLFPGRAEGLEPDAPDVIAVRDAPKPPPERISLSARRLRETRHVALLATGAAKREAVARLAMLDPAVPAAAVVPSVGLDVWLDEAAAADLP